MGLSIFYDLVVHKQPGDIRVISQEGKPAEFIVTIPK